MMKVTIYQINTERDIHRVKFMGYDSLKRFQGSQEVNSEIYDKVYEMESSCNDPEEVFEEFNLNIPDDFTGHSLSVSDVVELSGNCKSVTGFYFCDVIGFKKIAFCAENCKKSSALESLENHRILMKEEALKFMREFKLMDCVIESFQKKSVLYYSDRKTSTFDGILYWVSNNPEWAQMIQELERRFGILVYHAYHMHTTYGEILECLYISSDQDVWEDDLENAKKYGYAPVYAFNLTYPEYSEFGSAIYEGKNGGVSKKA